MKPHELYNIWAVFDKATTDPSFSAEQRYSLGQDMIACLPPEMLCSSSKPSLSVVREAMEGRLNDIDNERRKSKTGQRAGTSPMAGPGGADQSATAGDGISVEGLVDPKNKKKQARKESSQ